MTRPKNKGMIGTMMDNGKKDKDRFTRSVTEGKDYENLYDIGSAIRRIDGANLLVGVLGVLIGLLIFMLSVMMPFLMGRGFHLGVWSALGLMLFLSGLFYYIGAFRILHPLSKAVAVEQDQVIRGILKERVVVYESENENVAEQDP